MVTHCSVPVWKIPRTEELAGYSSWGQNELDTTEPLILSTGGLGASPYSTRDSL